MQLPQMQAYFLVPVSFWKFPKKKKADGEKVKPVVTVIGQRRTV